MLDLKALYEKREAKRSNVMNQQGEVEADERAKLTRVPKAIVYCWKSNSLNI